MASEVNPNYKEGLLSGTANHSLTTGTVKAVLIDNAAFSYSASVRFMTDVATAARIAKSLPLANKTVIDGVFDADDTTFSAVSGAVSEELLLMISAGSDGANVVVARIDTFASGMPVTPNGGDIAVAWDNGANKIFKL